MNNSVLLVEKRDGFATVTLNRPEKMNALSLELRRAIADTFRMLEEDGEVSVVIVTGAGKAFCAGLDLKELGSGDAEVGQPDDSGSDPARAIAGFWALSSGPSTAWR